jgi:hypothetical protein
VLFKSCIHSLYMPITIAERKHRMPHGAQKAVARDLGVDEAFVSKAMNDDIRPKTDATREKLAQVQAALAEKLGLPVADVFPPSHDHQHEAAPVAA